MKDICLRVKDSDGKERPGICVPIVAPEKERIFAEAERISLLPADMAEWRMDFFEGADRPEQIVPVLGGIKKRLGGKKLLATCRTRKEGGQYMGDSGAYFLLCRTAAGSGLVDLLDVEVFQAEEHAPELIRFAHEHGCGVVASSHDFEKTPPAEEMLRRLRRMEELGADAAKLAVMPSCVQDVLDLLQITADAVRELKIPVITMSMGELGAVSRVSGKLTGSALTFASAGEASAPGQIDVEKMAAILEAL